MQLKIVVRGEMHDFQNLVLSSVIFLGKDMIEHDHQFFVTLNSGMWVGTGLGGFKAIDKKLFIKSGSIVEKIDNKQAEQWVIITIDELDNRKVKQ